MATIAENCRRLDEHEKSIDNLYKKFDEYRMENVKQLAKIESKLEYQDATMKEVRDDVKGLKTSVSEILLKPAENMSKLNWILISLIATAVFGLVFKVIVN